MSIQTTNYVTREQAEEMFINKMLDRERRLYKMDADLLSNEELEDAIEDTYDNYTITK